MAAESIQNFWKKDKETISAKRWSVLAKDKLEQVFSQEISNDTVSWMRLEIKVSL